MLICPKCKSDKLEMGKSITCQECGSVYEIYSGKPILIKSDSRIFDWYNPSRSPMRNKKGLRGILKPIYVWLKPVARVWTRKSLNEVASILKEKNPNEGANVVLIGSGDNAEYRKLLSPYNPIIRIGLPTKKEVDVYCDICEIPLKDESIDMILSSSVLEHVYNPEIAVKEMHRVLKKGGLVYAEIPFIRANHMMPDDYQRYSIQGIEELFKRHGFKIERKGICSGSINGFILIFIDFWCSVFSFNLYLRELVAITLTLLLHPLKYRDRLFENQKWAQITACCFYYTGRKE